MSACEQCHLTATVLHRALGVRFTDLYIALLAESGHRHGDAQHPLRGDDD